MYDHHPDTLGALANERAADFRRSAERRRHATGRKRHGMGLRALRSECDAATLEAVVGPASEELAALVPELHARRSNEPAMTAALFEQLLGVFERLGDRVPTLVVIEDLHWADQSTRDLLVFL